MPIEVSPIAFADQQLPFSPKYTRPDIDGMPLPSGASGASYGPAAVAASAIIPPTPGGVAGPMHAIPALPDAGYTAPTLRPATFQAPGALGPGWNSGMRPPSIYGGASVYAGHSPRLPPAPLSTILSSESGMTPFSSLPAPRRAAPMLLHTHVHPQIGPSGPTQVLDDVSTSTVKPQHHHHHQHQHQHQHHDDRSDAGSDASYYARPKLPRSASSNSSEPSSPREPVHRRSASMNQNQRSPVLGPSHAHSPGAPSPLAARPPTSPRSETCSHYPKLSPTTEKDNQLQPPLQGSGQKPRRSSSVNKAGPEVDDLRRRKPSKNGSPEPNNETPRVNGRQRSRSQDYSPPPSERFSVNQDDSSTVHVHHHHHHHHRNEETTSVHPAPSSSHQTQSQNQSQTHRHSHFSHSQVPPPLSMQPRAPSPFPQGNMQMGGGGLGIMMSPDMEMRRRAFSMQQYDRPLPGAYAAPSVTGYGPQDAYDDGSSIAGSSLTFMDGTVGGRMSQYGLPKYSHQPKPDYRRFCVQRGNADVFLD